MNYSKESGKILVKLAEASDKTLGKNLEKSWEKSWEKTWENIRKKR
jgi:hypothetical protein